MPRWPLLWLALLACACATHTPAGQVRTPVARAARPWTAETCCLIAISVRDVEAAVPWYAGNLGFTVARAPAHPAPGVVVALLERGGLQLELVQVPGSADRRAGLPSGANAASLTGFFKLGISVQNLDDLLARLRAGGVAVRGEPYADREYGARYALIEDPDGNVLQLIEPLED